MDDFTKDMIHALEEAAEFYKVKRSKIWKGFGRSKSKSSAVLSSSLPKSSAKSEDSEFSLDNWKLPQMEFSTNGSYQPTDSEEIIYKPGDFSHHIRSSFNCSANLGESDSLNENFHLSREPRRKFKFKRIIIDPPLSSYTAYSSCPLFRQKNKRLRNLKIHKVTSLGFKSQKIKKVSVSQLSAEMENICKEFGNSASSCGKRKRCVHEHNLECSGCECKGNVSQTLKSQDISHTSDSCQHMDYDIQVSLHEYTSSGLSSSESDYGLLTNDDECREE